jgi:putative transposase
MDQLAGLTEEARKLALDRFRLLQPHLEDNRPLNMVAADAQISFRTAQVEWILEINALALVTIPRR